MEVTSMCVLKLTKEEYDVLNKIASISKMDCWFSIQESDDRTTDFVVDLENGTKMSLAEGITMLNDGINYPNGYVDCELDETEIVIYENLISKIFNNDDCQESDNANEQDSAITDDVNNLLGVFLHNAIIDAYDSIRNERAYVMHHDGGDDDSHMHNICVLTGFINKIKELIDSINSDRTDSDTTQTMSNHQCAIPVVDYEMIHEWIDTLFLTELDEIKGTMDNVSMWEKGYNNPDEPNPHTQNLNILREYERILKNAHSSAKEDMNYFR
jgi:hypothetical protein